MGVAYIDAIQGLGSPMAELVMVSLAILNNVLVDLGLCKSDLFTVAMRLMVVSSWSMYVSITKCMGSSYNTGSGTLTDLACNLDAT